MRIPLRIEGFKFFLGTAMTLGVASFFYRQFGWGWLLAVIVLLAAFFVQCLVFFRDPERTPDEAGEDVILSPADGTVMDVKEVREPGHMKGAARQVNIFLSVFNVHVQRAPLAGRVEFLRHTPGKFLMAFDPRAENENEQNWFGLRCGGHPVLVKQIAGAIAKRIVVYKREGEPAARGERIGMIQFGSQVDLLVPPHWDITVKKGDKLYGGKTVIGRVR